MILTFLALAILLLTNEIKPILLSRRLRYTLLLAPLLGTGFAIAWSFVPKRTSIRLLLAVVWIMAFLAYSQNEHTYIATKRKSLESLHAPPFHTLVYHPNIEVGPTESVLSLHPSRKITWITGDYYQKLINPANLVHLHYDGGGKLTFQTTTNPIDSLDNFVSKYAVFWMLYDPQETDEVVHEPHFPVGAQLLSVLREIPGRKQMPSSSVTSATQILASATQREVIYGICKICLGSEWGKATPKQLVLQRLAQKR